MKSIPKEMYQQNSIVQLTIPDTVTSIGESAFYGNNIAQLVIPANVATIERSVFRKNQLTELPIPIGVKKIDDYAFADNKLTSITPHPNMEIGVKSFNGNPLASLLVPAGITLVRPNADEGTNPWTDHFTDTTNVPAVWNVFSSKKAESFFNL
jgi:hypothetical protein